MNQNRSSTEKWSTGKIENWSKSIEYTEEPSENDLTADIPSRSNCFVFFVKVMLTVEHLQKMQPRQLIARWSFTDNSFWINYFWSGQVLKRVAVRWIWMHDRAIYIWPEFEASFVIAKNGDKLRGEDNIRRLVDCSDEAFALYRR